MCGWAGLRSSSRSFERRGGAEARPDSNDSQAEEIGVGDFGGLKLLSRRFQSRSDADLSCSGSIQDDDGSECWRGSARSSGGFAGEAREAGDGVRIPSRGEQELVAGAGLLGQRENLGFGDFHDRALRFDLESADGFDLIAEEFDAQGPGAFCSEDVEDAAADGIFADHLNRIAARIADGLEMSLDGVEREFLADAKVEGEPAVIRGIVDAKQRGGDGSDGDGRTNHSTTRHRPMARCSAISVCGESFCPGSTSQAGRSWGWPASGRAIKKAEKRLTYFGKEFRALVAVGQDQERLLRGLPRQDQVESLGGGRQTGESEGAGLPADEFRDQLLKRLMTVEGVEEIADGGVGHGRRWARQSARASTSSGRV